MMVITATSLVAVRSALKAATAADVLGKTGILWTKFTSMNFIQPLPPVYKSVYCFKHHADGIIDAGMMPCSTVPIQTLSFFYTMRRENDE